MRDNNAIEGYIRLADAIIMQACKDYLELNQHMSTAVSDYEIRSIQLRKQEIESFLESDYAAFLSRGTNIGILQKLRSE